MLACCRHRLSVSLKQGAGTMQTQTRGETALGTLLVVEVLLRHVGFGLMLLVVWW